jgi:predicted nucleic acid-binding protein
VIVVDNDVISYFWLEAGRTEAARRARERDGDWHAPRLWSSEFRNVLYQHMARRGLSRADAQQIAETVEADMDGATYTVSSADVLRLSGEADHPTYDCEYVALAQELGVTLVTGDRAVANLFSDTAVLLEDFASGEE